MSCDLNWAACVGTAGVAGWRTGSQRLPWTTGQPAGQLWGSEDFCSPSWPPAQRPISTALPTASPFARLLQQPLAACSRWACETWTECFWSVEHVRWGIFGCLSAEFTSHRIVCQELRDGLLIKSNPKWSICVSWLSTVTMHIRSFSLIKNCLYDGNETKPAYKSDFSSLMSRFSCWSSVHNARPVFRRSPLY